MKLIRDKLALTPSPDGRTVILVDEEIQKRLILEKLVEESFEVQKSRTPDEMISELADVLQVIDRILALYHIEEGDVKRRAEKKHFERGGFDTGYALL